MTPKLLASRTKYHDQYGDSGIFTFTVRSKKVPTQDELCVLRVFVRECRHVHDCCGCFQYAYPNVEGRNKRNEWRVTQHWYRNV